MNADDLIELWVERVKQGEPVELPWKRVRESIFRDGTPREGWQRMVAMFAAKGVRAAEERRGKPNETTVWVILSLLQ